MKKPLNVFYKQRKVGTLEKAVDDTLAFTYASEWLNSRHNFALTPALPLQDESFNNRLSKSYFDNLLPEGETLKIFESILKKSFDDPYQILEGYGLDCAGALEISPLDQSPENSLTGNASKISFSEIDKVIDDKGSLYVHTLTKHKGKFSLAGAQDKIPVIFKDGEILLPQDASPTTHILKPPARLSGIFESVYNEYLCMQIAQLAGFPVPETAIVGEENPLFLIERYDRKLVDGKVERIHQFDLCQAQGYPAAEKYESDGGPNFTQNYQTLQKISDQKIKDSDLALRWLCLNLVLGNNDSHSKNLSFLSEESSLKIAPIYDLMSTAVYDDLSNEFAFNIGGQKQWHKLNKKHFNQLANQLGFTKREDIIITTLLEECEKIEIAGLPFLDAFLEDHRSSLVTKKLRGEIEKRVKYFRQKLS